MIIREMRADERATVRSVLAEAFGRPVVADLADALMDRADAGRGIALNAVDEDSVVGHVQLSISWVDAPDRLVEVLVLSPLGVVKSRQRKGIGRQLVEAALAVADERTVPAVFLEGDPRYYSRLGFERADTYGITKPSVRIPDAGFQISTRRGYDESVRGALVYNDTFWAFDCVGLRKS